MIPPLALIGAGGIGAYHLASIRKLERCGQARLAAVVEPMVDRFPELRRELESRQVRWYTDYRDMLRAEDELDAVTVAAPIPYHYEMTLACLERGVFVNLEKPPVPLVQQLETLIRADARGSVTVGFQMILSQCVQRMKQLIVEGTIGEVRSIRARGCWPRRDSYYQRAGWAGKMVLDGEPVFDGPVTNALAHVVHNIMFLASPAAGGFAVPAEVQGELYRARPIESYDLACLRGKFASGPDFFLAATHATKEAMPYTIEVRGTRGWLRLSDDGGNLLTGSGESWGCAQTTADLLDVGYDRFLETMRSGGRQTGTSLKDTAGYVRATNGLLLSSGGIHNIDPAWIGRYGEGGDVGFDVRDLRATIERAFAEGKLFSELDLPWAVAKAVPVRLDGLQHVALTADLLLSAA